MRHKRGAPQRAPLSLRYRNSFVPARRRALCVARSESVNADLRVTPLGGSFVSSRSPGLATRRGRHSQSRAPHSARRPGYTTAESLQTARRALPIYRADAVSVKRLAPCYESRNRVQAAGGARRARVGRARRHGWRGPVARALTNEPPRRVPVGRLSAAGEAKPSRGPKGAAPRDGGRPTRDRSQTEQCNEAAGRLRTPSAVTRLARCHTRLAARESFHWSDAPRRPAFTDSERARHVPRVPNERTLR